MTQPSKAPTELLIAALPSRSRAFRRAGRHSTRVRWLRRGIFIGCAVGVIALAGYAFFDPFGKLPQNLSMSQVGLNGSRITMEAPKLSGYREDGKRYDVRAASGVQDIHKPNIIELNDIDAKFDTNEQATVHLVSPRGVYDSSHDFLTLQGDVRITSPSGYDIHMHSADVNFKTGTMASNEPVTVVMTSGTIAANRVDVGDHGQRISFQGDVRTVLRAAAGPSEGSDREQ